MCGSEELTVLGAADPLSLQKFNQLSVYLLTRWPNGLDKYKVNQLELVFDKPQIVSNETMSSIH